MKRYYKFPKPQKSSTTKESITIVFDKNDFIASLAPYIKINHVLQDGEYQKIKNIEHEVKNQQEPDKDLIEMIDNILNRDKLNYERKSRHQFCESR